jgi:PTS system mannose-specific IID component
MKKTGKIRYRELISIFFRSFFIQAVYNYQSMLAIGFCFALMPISRKLFASSEKKKNFFIRHLHFFNAHPYFSSYALGAITRVEEDLVKEHADPSRGDKNDYSKIERLKNALIGPLGALGDQLIWVNIRPASILFAMALIIIIKNIKFQLAILVILFLLYNIPHMYIRLSGIITGYRQGINVYRSLTLDNFSLLKNIYRTIGALSLGILFSYSITTYSQENLFHGIIFLTAMVSSYLYKKLKQSFYGSIIVPLLFTILLGIIIEIL